MFFNSKIKFTLAIIFFCLSFLFLAKAFFLSYLPDFSNYYFGAKHVIQNENPYIKDSNYFTDQSYPPFTLLLFMPFTAVSFDIASKIWMIISLASIIITLFFLYKIHYESFFKPVNLLLSSLVFLSFPVKFSLGMGQINFFVLLFLVISIYFLQRKKYDLSGVFLSFPLMIKFFPLLLLPYFATLKKIKLFRGLLITFLTMIVIIFIFFSFTAIDQYYFKILPDLLSSWKGEYYNQSLTGFVMRGIDGFTQREITRFILSGLLVISLLIVFIKQKRNPLEVMNLKIAAIIVLTVLINSFSWQHHYIWLIIPFFITFFYIKNKFFHWKYLLILTTSYFLVAINIKDPQSVNVLVQSHVFYGGIVLYYFILFLLWKAKK